MGDGYREKDQRTPEMMHGDGPRFTGWRGRSPENLVRWWEERWEEPLFAGISQLLCLTKLTEMSTQASLLAAASHTVEVSELKQRLEQAEGELGQVRR